MQLESYIAVLTFHLCLASLPLYSSALGKAASRGRAQHRSIYATEPRVARQQHSHADTSKAWCSAMDQLEELHGKWMPSNQVRRDLMCPDWTRDVDCLHGHGPLDTWQERHARQEYDHVFVPKSCKLHAWDAPAFDQCMAGRRLLFIGDSLMRQMFQSLACLLSPVTATASGDTWSNASMTSDIQYTMPGFLGPHITKQLWADVELKSGGNLHARLFGSFSRQLVEDILAELPSLTASDVIVVNFGAWYPRFERQGSSVVISKLFKSYERDMAQLLRLLRGTPALILWRSYAPTHFGGESGAFVSGQETQEECLPAEEGEVWYDQWVREYVTSCGEECKRIHMLPIYQLSLPRHSSHMGVLGFTVGELTDCRHWCNNVVDVWNQVLLNKLLSTCSKVADSQTS